VCISANRSLLYGYPAFPGLCAVTRLAGGDLRAVTIPSDYGHWSSASVPSDVRHVVFADRGAARVMRPPTISGGTCPSSTKAATLQLASVSESRTADRRRCLLVRPAPDHRGPECGRDPVEVRLGQEELGRFDGLLEARRAGGSTPKHRPDFS